MGASTMDEKAAAGERMPIRLRLRRASLRVAGALLNATSHGLRMLPLGARYLPADALTSVLIRTMRRRMAVTAANFAVLLGTAPDDPRARRLARESVRNYGRMSIDFITIRTMAAAEVGQRTELVGVANMDDALADGHGVILALPHVGSWDAAAVFAESYGLRLTVVTEANWVTELVAGSRLGHGMSLAPRDRSLRQLFRALARQECVVMLADVANEGVQTLDVPFFDHPSPFPVGPARLALRTRAPIVVVGALRQPGGRFRMEAHSPLRGSASRSEDENVAALTAEIARGFERIIRAAPAQWYPYHPIWPTLAHR